MSIELYFLIVIKLLTLIWKPIEYEILENVMKNFGFVIVEIDKK